MTPLDLDRRERELAMRFVKGGHCGTGEALMMIMAGRPDALADLDGAGVVRLAARVR